MVAGHVTKGREKMSKQDDWMSEYIRQARTDHSLVNDQTARQVKHLLETSFGERQLSRSELEEIAKRLIADMNIAGMPKIGKDK